MDLARSLIARGPFSPTDYKEARDVWAQFRADNGAAATYPRLLTDPDHNFKFAKTEAKVYGLSLAHASTSGVNGCRYSTPECRKGCVSYAGNGMYKKVQAARQRKTLFLNSHPDAFLGLLEWELDRVWSLHGKDARVRLNTFSDLPWESIHPGLFLDLPKMKFYDYTKWPVRQVPQNYRLTFSASEKTKDQDVLDMLETGRNVAVVFAVGRTKDLPKTYLGHKVIDGDKSDDRYLDRRPRIVGLRTKGIMRSQGGKMPRKVS